MEIHTLANYFTDGIKVSIPNVSNTTPPIPPYMPPGGPMPNITPFTFRDGWTYLERYENLVKYINRVIIPFVNDNYTELADTFVEQVNLLIDAVNKAIEDILNSSIEIQDPLVAQIFNDPASDTRAVTDVLYAAKSVVDSIADTINTGRLSDTALEAKYALDTTVQVIEDLVNTGRLSKTQLDATYALKSDLDAFTDIVTQGYLAKTALDKNYRSYNTAGGFKKRVVHNLVYQHADWAAAYALWGSLFPQTFAIDDVAGEIFTMSDSGIVSVYDWTTGAYKNACFKLAGVAAVNQSLVVRYISGQRYLFVRNSSTQFARYNITILPVGQVTVTAATTYAISSISDFGFWDGEWYIGSLQSDNGSNTFNERGKFNRYAADLVTYRGLLLIDSMRYGGSVGGGIYQQSAFPKSQGFAAGPGVFGATIGGGWDINIPPAGTINDPYYYQGVRVFDSAGNVIADSLVSAQTMLNYFSTKGYQPNHVETEGVSYAYGHFHSLYAIASSGTAAAQIGGFVIMEEFSTADDAYDFSPNAVTWSNPNIDKVQSQLQPMRPDQKIINLATNAALTSIADIFDYMRGVNQHQLNFYSTYSDIVMGDGVGQFPTASYIECRLLSSTSLQVRCSNLNGVTTYTYWWDGSVWRWTPSDTGWTDIVLNAGFVVQNGETPQVRLRNGWVSFRGTLGNATIVAATAVDIATLPALYRPVLRNAGGNMMSSAAATMASVLIAASTGVMNLRPNTALGTYYSFASIAPYLIAP